LPIRDSLVVGKCFRSPTVEAYAYVVGWNQGEALIDGRGRTNSINVSPATGSINVGLTTQDMPPGSGIAVHQHSTTEEILFIYEGEATLIVGEERVPVKAGDTVFVPPGIDHGLENHDSRVRLVGVVTPPGLEGFFREISWRPGDEPKQFTPDQIQEIADRYYGN
jgi:quercetin dioxygenase-like cupin family protein